MNANDAVRILGEREMEAIVGGQTQQQGPPTHAGDGDGTVVK